MAIVYHVSAIKSSMNKAIEYVGNKDKTSYNEEVKNALDYISNETKISLNESELIIGYNASSNKKMFQLEMEELKKSYNKNGGILAHHYIQSFSPEDKINPEQALEIGYKLASECFTNYQVLITTHTDKKHIHNHFIINSVSLDGKKYVDTKKQLNFNRSVSDRLCKEYGYSVVEQPKEKGKSYKEWSESKKGTSWKDKIKNDIDTTIKNSRTFDEFISEMKQKGYSIKYGNVKYIAFKPSDKERFVRGKTLGVNYTEESIKNSIRLNSLGVEVNGFKKKSYAIKGSIKRKNRKNVYSKLTTTIAILNLILGSNKRYYSNKKFKPSEKYKKYINYKQTTVKDLAMQLNFAKENNIKNTNDIYEKITLIDSKIEKFQTSINKLEDINSKLLYLKRFAEIYNENKTYLDMYDSSKFKITVKVKYSDEINKCLEAKNQLEKHGVDIKEIDKVIYNLESNKVKLQSIEDNLSKLEDSKKDYNKLLKTVKRINNNQKNIVTNKNKHIEER